MQVRKRNGDTEPVDVNKIVRAVERWADDLADVDPLRVATKTISGLYDGATTAELDRLSIQTAAEMIGEEPQYSRLAARLLAGVRRQGGPRPGHRLVQPGDRARPRRGADRRRDRRVRRRTTPASSTTRSTRTPTGGSSTSGCAPSTTATCCATRSRRLVVETPQYWLLRVACGLSRTPAEAIELLPADVVAGLPAQLADAVQLRHPAHPDVVLLPGRLPARRARLDLRPLRAGREAVQVRRRHRHLLVAGPLAAAR